MAITYQLGDKLYINLTNRCTNDCKFCVRKFKDGVGGYNLWLEEEPTAEEVIADIGQADQYQEIIFCGYGEPLIRVEAVSKIAQYLTEHYPQIPVRINTNGLANLIHERNVLPELAGDINQISISLNASNAETYQAITQSQFGEKAFPALIDFIKQAQDWIPKVTVSVVRHPEIDIAACRELAEELEVNLKIRG